VEVPGEAGFAGYVSLREVSFAAHFTPATEAGWSLKRAFWGRGFATEAASAAIEWGFRQRELDQVMAMTVAGNRRSRRVAERLGMTRDPSDDFLHPSLPPAHHLAQFVLYRLARGSR